MGLWIMNHLLSGMHIQVGIFFIVSPYVGGVTSVIVFRMGCSVGLPHPGILGIRRVRILMDIGYVGSIDVCWVIYCM